MNGAFLDEPQSVFKTSTFILFVPGEYIRIITLGIFPLIYANPREFCEQISENSHRLADEFQEPFSDALPLLNTFREAEIGLV